MNSRRILRITALSILLAAGFLRAQVSDTDLIDIRAVNGNKLTIRRFAVVEEKTIELKGITIQDSELAKEITRSYRKSSENLNTLFLENGSSYINLDARSLVGENEKAAQDRAAENRLGIWKNVEMLDRFGYKKLAKAAREELRREREGSLLNRSKSWVAGHWDLALVLAIASVVLGIIPLLYRRRHFDVIVLGARGVGKSVFLKRVSDDASLIKIGETEATRGENLLKIVNLRSRNGRNVFHIQPIEIGGQYPGKAFERFAQKKWRNKIALVFVLSPFSLRNNNIPSTNLDPGFVERQLGWAESLIKGFLESAHGRKRCRGILLFANMFDLFSPNRDDIAKKDEFAAQFYPHLLSVRSSQKDAQLLVGSAQNLWTTNEAKFWIYRTVSGEVGL